MRAFFCDIDGRVLGGMLFGLLVQLLFWGAGRQVPEGMQVEVQAHFGEIGGSSGGVLLEALAKTSAGFRYLGSFLKNKYMYLSLNVPYDNLCHHSWVFMYVSCYVASSCFSPDS